MPSTQYTLSGILAKIQKLRNMIVERGCSEQEAANAEFLANMLALKHNVVDHSNKQIQLDPIRDKALDPYQWKPTRKGTGFSFFWCGYFMYIFGNEKEGWIVGMKIPGIDGLQYGRNKRFADRGSAVEAAVLGVEWMMVKDAQRG